MAFHYKAGGSERLRTGVVPPSLLLEAGKQPAKR